MHERQPSRSRGQTQGGLSPRGGSNTAIGRKGEDEGSRVHTTKRRSRAHKTSSDPGEASYPLGHTKIGGSRLAPPASVVGAQSGDRSKSPVARERASSTASGSRASPSAPKPKETRRKSRTASKASPQSGSGTYGSYKDEIPEACLWESSRNNETQQQAVNQDDREVLSYAQRRATVLAEQKYRESISYSNRRATQMAVAAATAKATGEEPKYLSYGEYRKTMSYAARRESRMRGSAVATSPTPSPGGLTSPSTTQGTSPVSSTSTRHLQPHDDRPAARSRVGSASLTPRGDKSPRDKSPRTQEQSFSKSGSANASPSNSAKATPQSTRAVPPAPPAVSTTSKTVQPGSQSAPGSRPYRPPPRVQESSDSEDDVKMPMPKRKAAPAPPNGMRMF